MIAISVRASLDEIIVLFYDTEGIVYWMDGSSEAIVLTLNLSWHFIFIS